MERQGREEIRLKGLSSTRGDEEEQVRRNTVEN